MPTPHNLVAPPVIIAATPVRPLASPQPAIAPSLPPVCTVDLMTLEGSAIFGAQWKTKEAKIIEVPPIPDAMPEFKTTYDIDPHAGEAGFDDSAWTSATFGIGFETGDGQATAIAYSNNAGNVGVQTYTGSLGHDFQVNSAVTVTSLGVFDSGNDVISSDEPGWAVGIAKKPPSQTDF